MAFIHVFVAYGAMLLALYATTTPKAVPPGTLAAEAARSCDVIEVDHFLFNHFFGWMLCTYWVRNPVIGYTISLIDEVSEYSFQRVMPNWVECWWDRWLLDIFGANLLGVCLGAWIVRGTEHDFRTISWRGALCLVLVRSTWFFIDFMYKLFVYDPRQIDGAWLALTAGLQLVRSWYLCQLAKQARHARAERRAFACGMALSGLDVALHHAWGTFTHVGPLDARAVGTFLVGGGLVAGMIWVGARVYK